jgi:hypothetical protein
VVMSASLNTGCLLDGILQIKAAALKTLIQLYHLRFFLDEYGQRFAHMLLQAVERQGRIVVHDVHALRDVFRHCNHRQ